MRADGRTAARQASQAISSSDLLEAGDEQLDAGVVGQDLAGRRELAAEDPAQDRVEEEHRVGAERAVRPAGLEEMDGRAGQAAELDLARDLLDEFVALLLGRLVRAHAGPPMDSTGSTRVGWSAPLNAS